MFIYKKNVWLSKILSNARSPFTDPIDNDSLTVYDHVRHVYFHIIRSP